VPVTSGDAEKEAAVRGDDELVADCLKGGEEAWAELIDKYKNLIFSIPIKYGFSRDEAADIFQEVCMNLLSDLKNVREPKALPKWIIMVTSHKCYHAKAKSQRLVSSDSEKSPVDSIEVPPVGDKLVEEAETEQRIREAVAAMSPRCQQLVQMLFFEEPSRPYKAIANSLGISTGSIGFMRQQCLDRLRTRLKGKLFN
jgi:RNA polymerase sigma factor (sigma-70 family)